MLESACAGFLALRDKATEILRRGEASSASAAREMGARWRWSDFGTRWEQTLPVWPEEHSPYLAIVATDIFFSAYRELGASGGVPPSVLLLLAANCGTFLKPGGLRPSQVCLNPWCVVKRGELHRLATSTFVHHDLEHLLSNMGPLISDGSFLERRQGSVKFLGCVAAATMMSSSLYVGLQYMLARHTPHKAGYYSSGAVGFSGVGMALSVIAGFEMRGQILIMGAFEIPSEFKAWYQLISSQLLLPSSSFEGHACGMAAGLIWVFGPRCLRYILGLLKGHQTRGTVNQRQSPTGSRGPSSAMKVAAHAALAIFSVCLQKWLQSRQQSPSSAR